MSLAILVSVCICICVCSFPAKQSFAQSEQRPEAMEAANRILAAMEIILEHHIAPPQMLLTGTLRIAGTNKEE
jgi:hypothetical protein